MIYVTPLMILTATSGCKSKPITVVQVDAVNEQLNPWVVNDIDNNTCKLKGNLKPAEPLFIDDKINQKLHGGVWVSKEDYAEILKAIKTECFNRKSGVKNGQVDK